MEEEKEEDDILIQRLKKMDGEIPFPQFKWGC